MRFAVWGRRQKCVGTQMVMVAVKGDDVAAWVVSELSDELAERVQWWVEC